MARSVIFHVRKELQPFVTLCHHAFLVQKTYATSFLDVYQRRPENFFHYGCPNSLVNAILPRFLHIQDFFYILASLMQIQEMML